MITEQEAQELMITLIQLRNIAKSNNPSDLSAYRSHEKLCIEKFSYLITMRASKYRAFSNYDDLCQEGFEALLKGMKNYNPSKGSVFWWLHHYVGTRISRCANLHTTIRYPLKVAKTNIPHKENIMPILIEQHNCPDVQMENAELYHLLNKGIDQLTDNQKQVLNMFYGLDDNKISISKVCKDVGMSRTVFIKTLGSAIETIKNVMKTQKI